MDEGTRAAIEDCSRRVFAEDAGAHRQYLERQFSQLRWSVTVILAIVLAAVYFFTGRTIDKLESYARSQVDERIINYLVKDTVRAQLDEQIRIEVDQKVHSPETQSQISLKLESTISSAVQEKASKEINKAVDREVERIKNIELLPRGTIVAWYEKDKSVPPGWAPCDGSQGTPDLRERFLIGAGDGSSVGKQLGSTSHSHSINAQTSDARLVSDGWRVRERGAPAATGLDHRHTIHANTSSASHLPPSTYVIFIMKL